MEQGGEVVQIGDPLVYAPWGDTLLASWGGSSAALQGIDTPAATARALASDPEPWDPPSLPAAPKADAWGVPIPLPSTPPPSAVITPWPITGGDPPVTGFAPGEGKVAVDYRRWISLFGILLLAVVLIGVGLNGIVGPGGKAAVAGGVVGGAVQGAVGAI